VRIGDTIYFYEHKRTSSKFHTIIVVRRGYCSPHGKMAVAISFSHFYLEVVGNSEKELKQSLPGISICLNVLHETLFDLRK